MIIYIHGFGGSGLGVKAKLSREMFKYEIVMAPSLPYVPDLAVATLRELIDKFLKKGEPVQLIGSSLGGYYALYLADLFRLKAVLVNPSIYPYKSLESSIGMVPNFYDGSSFEWNGKHIGMLRNYEVKNPNQENLLLLVQKGDELLDYREALEKLPRARAVVEEGGSHGFDNFESQRGVIEEFFQG